MDLALIREELCTRGDGHEGDVGVLVSVRGVAASKLLFPSRDSRSIVAIPMSITEEKMLPLLLPTTALPHAMVHIDFCIPFLIHQADAPGNV